MNEQRLIDVANIDMAEMNYCAESPHDFENACQAAQDFIDAQPTIDPETLPIVKELRAKLAECEPKHGHWKFEFETPYCSECGKNPEDFFHTEGYDTVCMRWDTPPYCCPNCGAKMDEK